VSTRTRSVVSSRAPVGTPSLSTTRWSLFPPRTSEVQFDEKWSFVGKKERNCDPEDLDDAEQGDNWDHVAFDPVSRLVVSLVTGKRTTGNTRLLVADFRRRTEGRMMRLMASDEYPAYREAILDEYGVTFVPPRTGRVGRPKRPYKVPPDDLLYATVHKTRKNGRVVKVETRLVFGTKEKLAEALADSPVSEKVGTSYIERYNATSRHMNGRESRKVYTYSKDWDLHGWASWFTTVCYNFCHDHWSLRVQVEPGRYEHRSPAMAAGLADHIWSVAELLNWQLFDTS